MTKTKSIQSVLKDARNNFPVRNDCTGVIKKHTEYCQGCIEIMIIEPDELDNFLLSSLTDLLHSEIEEIKLKRKNLAIVIDKNGKECMTPSEWEDKGYNEAVDEVVELLVKRIEEVTSKKE
jgi:hypothetical protein